MLLSWPFAPEPSSGSDGQEIMHLTGSGPNGQANDRRTGQRVGNWAANGAGTSQKVGIAGAGGLAFAGRFSTARRDHVLTVHTLVGSIFAAH